MTFAFSADGSQAVRDQPVAGAAEQADRHRQQLSRRRLRLEHRLDPAGPWTKIADSHKLANSRLGAQADLGGKGYGPGIQAWYNQFLAVDPANPNHVYAGLEEVYETTDGGASWNDRRPVLELRLPLLEHRPDAERRHGLPADRPTPTSTRSPSARCRGKATSTSATTAASTGGRSTARPTPTATPPTGRASTTARIDALQYYSVGVGGRKDVQRRPRPASCWSAAACRTTAGRCCARRRRRWARTSAATAATRSSTRTTAATSSRSTSTLSMRVTQNCAQPGSDRPNAIIDLSTVDHDRHLPADVNARFIAPFAADDEEHRRLDRRRQHALVPEQGLRHPLRRPSGRRSTPRRRGPRSRPRSPYSGNTAIAAWCGPCNNAGFTRGVAVGNVQRHGLDLAPESASRGVPNRYIAGAASTRCDADNLVSRGERLLSPLHRGAGRRYRSHLRVDRRRRDLEDIAATSRTSRPTASRCWRTGRSSSPRTSASSIGRASESDLEEARNQPPGDGRHGRRGRT